MRCADEFRQRGVVLVFSLLVLLMLGLLVTAVMRGSIMQVRLARNLESTALERQRALAGIERVLQHLGTEAPKGAAGDRHCMFERDGCDTTSLADVAEPAGVEFAYVSVIAVDRPPPRVDEASASSGLAYRAVHYEVGAVSGQVSLVQGVAVLVAGERQ